MSDTLMKANSSIPEGLLAISERYTKVLSTFRAKMGEPAVLDHDVTRAVKHCDTLAARLDKGDMRYKESELQAMRDMATWTVQMIDKLNDRGTQKVWRSKNWGI